MKFKTKEKKVNAHQYDGKILPLKHFMGIENAKYDADDRDFIIPMEYALFGTDLVAHNTDFVVKDEETGKFFVQTADKFLADHQEDTDYGQGTEEQSDVLNESPAGYEFTPTFGEKAVGITFNHAEGKTYDAVSNAKKQFAGIIDQANDFRNLPETTQEQKRLASIAITEAQGAQMWLVKALTWKD